MNLLKLPFQKFQSFSFRVWKYKKSDRLADRTKNTKKSKNNWILQKLSFFKFSFEKKEFLINRKIGLIKKFGQYRVWKLIL